jgi:RNA polymerase sigma factor (TIGR02999 family)
MEAKNPRLATAAGVRDPSLSPGESPMTETPSITQLLAQARAGEAGAFDHAFELVHEQLRALAHRQLRKRAGVRDQMLCTTALVNETWMKLVRAGAAANDREHFLAMSARAMRMIVVDEARRLLSAKRGGDQLRVTLEEGYEEAQSHGADDLIALDAAMQRLAEADPRLAQVVEWRYFAGMTEAEIAAQLAVTERTVRRDWRKARAFLQLDMARAGAG